MLVTACSSAASSPTATSSPASSPATSARPAAPSSDPATPTATPSAVPSVTASPAVTRTFLAQGQDINGTALFMPTCDSGCPLSGDSTAILDTMTWRIWSASEAVGTGTYKLDACNPSCAAGPVYPVAAVVTLSQPVKVCSSSGTRWFWSRAAFRFPDGLPTALSGASAPRNPWVFSSVAAAARQSCAG